MSTPLCENVPIGPKVSIFCVVILSFQHCLNPLGHGVYQSFTGCHWSPLPLLHDDIMELVDVKRPCAPPPSVWGCPTDAQWGLGLETCLASPSPLPSDYLARQWSLSCWNTALRPSLQREGIMLCFSMSQYMLAFVVPSMNCSSPVPAALMQPDHYTPTTVLNCRQDTCLCTPHLVATTHAWHHLNRIHLSWSHLTTGHGSSNPCP